MIGLPKSPGHLGLDRIVNQQYLELQVAMCTAVSHAPNTPASNMQLMGWVTARRHPSLLCMPSARDPARPQEIVCDVWYGVLRQSHRRDLDFDSECTDKRWLHGLQVVSKMRELNVGHFLGQTRKQSDAGANSAKYLLGPAESRVSCE